MARSMGVAYCGLGPQGKALGLCLCYCKDCDPDNLPSQHCKNHYNKCHRKCGAAARTR